MILVPSIQVQSCYLVNIRHIVFVHVSTSESLNRKSSRDDTFLKFLHFKKTNAEKKSNSLYRRV